MVTYLYDVVNRLTKEQRSGTANDYTREYWYDKIGNRTKLIKNGSTTTSYTYNNLNQLTKHTTGGTNVTFLYDASGNLTRQYQNASNYRYYYWNSGNSSPVFAI